MTTTAYLTEGLRLTHDAIDADAATWVEAHRRPLPRETRAYRREWLRRLDEVREANEVLRLHLRTLHRLAAAAPGDAPVADPDFPTAAAVARWCSHALAGIDGLRQRLDRERAGLAGLTGGPG